MQCLQQLQPPDSNQPLLDMFVSKWLDDTDCFLGYESRVFDDACSVVVFGTSSLWDLWVCLCLGRKLVVRSRIYLESYQYMTILAFRMRKSRDADV